MKKISLNGISHILSEKELKNVMAGSANDCPETCGFGTPCLTNDGFYGICERIAGECNCTPRW